MKILQPFAVVFGTLALGAIVIGFIANNPNPIIAGSLVLSLIVVVYLIYGWVEFIVNKEWKQ